MMPSDREDVANGVYPVPPTKRVPGTPLFHDREWVPLFTEILRASLVAASNDKLPPWVALTKQLLPALAAVKTTVSKPDKRQPDPDTEYDEMARPDEADAVTVYDVPTSGLDGALGRLTDCVPLYTVMEREPESDKVSASPGWEAVTVQAEPAGVVKVTVDPEIVQLPEAANEYPEV